MKDGLFLLLRFAYGPLTKGVCGNPRFAKKVKLFLEGDKSLEEKIRKEIPRQLKVAWRNLVLINKNEPLSLKTVSTYVFNNHNLFAMPGCKVRAGMFTGPSNFWRRINVRTKTNRCELIVQFLGNPHIEVGDLVAFHHGWFVAKISEKQYKGLK